MVDDRKFKGKVAEDVAAYYLQQQGYQLIERNWRCRTGELDIIAVPEHEKTIVIIEVRSRSSDSYGTAAESVDWRKQSQIRETAAVYAHHHHYSELAFRYDVITVRLNKDYEAVNLEHWIEAFT